MLSKGCCEPGLDYNSSLCAFEEIFIEMHKAGGSCKSAFLNNLKTRGYPVKTAPNAQ